MNITGTNRSDYILGTAESDTIDGRRGNDWIEGKAGNDFLHGGQGRDTFVIREGDGVDVVDDFLFRDAKNFNVDRVLFDIYGSYSDVLFLGGVYDGLVVTTFAGGTFTFSAVDYDGDGVTDTQVLAGTGDGIILLGVDPDSLTGAGFSGG